MMLNEGVGQVLCQKEEEYNDQKVKRGVMI